jgi:hypothetical protein
MFNRTLEQPSYHKLCDVKPLNSKKFIKTLLRKFRIKSEMETTCNSSISCLKRNAFDKYSKQSLLINFKIR